MNLFEQFKNSIVNVRSYHSLSRTKGGKSFLYIFLLFLLVYLIGSIYSLVQFNTIISHLQTSMKDNMPDFQLSNGAFTFEGEMPYRIEESDFLIIIDTTGKTTVEDFKNIENGLLITEDEITTISMGTADVTPFSMIGPLSITKDQILKFLPSLKVIFVIIVVIGFLFAFAAKLFGILMLTLTAMIATSLFHQKLSFLNQWNTAIYASTLPMLIKLANKLSGGPLDGFMFLIYWGTAITYVFLAIYYMSDTPDQEPVPAFDSQDTADPDQYNNK